jgi:UDP-GlcNAc:undecaprenyl-phosphate GlcNAc-1-phosphate transferase
VLPLVSLMVAAVPFVGTSLLVPVVMRYCLTKDLLDHPSGRKQHRVPVPRLGGVAFFVSFSASVGVGFLVAPYLSPVPGVRAVFADIAIALSEAHLVATPLFGLLAGALVIFLVGLIDDLLGERFPVGLKFLGQCLAAALAVGCGIQVEFAGSGFLNLAVSFLWILGISNAFNLLDNMDGLSAGVAVCSAFIFFLNAFALGEIFLCLILAAFMGALLGFLRFNSHPARLFMGDAGALFIGFVLSSLTILEHYVSPASSSLFPVLMPPLVLAVPLIDTLSVIVIRVREGRPIYRGDRCHLSHRLVASGFTEAQAVKCLFLFTLAVGMGALHLANASIAHSVWTVAYTTIAAGLVLSGLRMSSQWNEGGIRRDVSTHRSSNPVEGL